MTTVDDLTAFVRAQLDEDERDRLSLHYGWCDNPTASGHDSCNCGYPDRVAAEVEAKRRILDEHQRAQDGFTWTGPITEPGSERVPLWICSRCSDLNPDALVDEQSHTSHEWPCLTVRALAQPFAGRDGWREEWRV